MPLPKRLLVWTIFVVMATGQSLQAADPLTKPEANPIPRPAAKSPAKPEATAVSKTESSGRKIIIKQIPSRTNLYDLYIFYEGDSKPIAGVTGNTFLITPQIDKRDAARILFLQIAHRSTIAGLEERSKGDYLEAEKSYKLAIKSAESFDKSNVVLKSSLLALAGLYLHMDKAAESEKLYRRCLAILNEEDDANEQTRAILIDNLAQAFSHQKKYTEAETCHKNALALFKAMKPPVPLDVAKCLGNIAAIRVKQRQYAEAQTYFREAIKLAQQAGDERYLAILYDGMAVTYGAQGLNKEELEQHLKALALLEQSYGPNHPETAVCLASIGRTYLELHDYKNAADYLKRAHTIVANALGAESSIAIELDFEYRACLSKL